MSTTMNVGVRSTGKSLKAIDPTGMLFACQPGAPADVPGALLKQVAEGAFLVAPLFLGMLGSPFLYLPLFATPTALCALYGRFRAPFVQIKEIDNGERFVEAFPRKVHNRETRLIVDLRFAADGRVVFTELKWD